MLSYFCGALQYCACLLNYRQRWAVWKAGLSLEPVTQIAILWGLPHTSDSDPNIQTRSWRAIWFLGVLTASLSLVDRSSTKDSKDSSLRLKSVPLTEARSWHLKNRPCGPSKGHLMMCPSHRSGQWEPDKYFIDDHAVMHGGFKTHTHTQAHTIFHFQGTYWFVWVSGIGWEWGWPSGSGHEVSQSHGVIELCHVSLVKPVLPALQCAWWLWWLCHLCSEACLSDQRVGYKFCGQGIKSISSLGSQQAWRGTESCALSLCFKSRQRLGV